MIIIFVLPSNSEMQKVVQLAKDFKDDVLLPLSGEGVLDKDLLLEVLDLYVAELNEKINPNAPILIGTEGNLSKLNPSLTPSFKIDGKEWPTVEHYRLASDFMDVDEELVEYIREAKTTVIAKRRCENALLREVKKRFNHEELRDTTLKTAYTVLLHSNPTLLEELKGTGTAVIFFQGNNDPYLSTKDGKDGYNAVGKTLMALRSEL